MANDNGWGDGVLNNTIGWGKGADNNTIGWGSVYGDSEAGLTALESAGGGTIPVISGVPSISAETQVGETITATAASATGDPTPTTSWTWQRSADGSTGWADIIGATSITYTLVVADDANYVRAVQTETNASGSDSANSLASAQITPAVDPDAQAYITAAGITDPTEQAAVNQLVLDLKGSGSTTNNTDVWSDSYTIYPLSPTSLTAAEYNLKDPTQNITWLNSPTHAYTGITGNGTNAYGDTNWNPTTEGVDINNAGLTYSGEYSDVDYALGVYNSVRWFVIRNSANRKISYIGASSAAANPIDFNRSISTAVRTSGTLIKMYTNGTQSSSNSASSGGSVVPNANFFLLGYSNSGALSAPFAGEMDFAAIHKGLTANQAKDLSDAITTYNTAVR